MSCWLCGFATTDLATDAKVPTCKNGPCQICREVANIDEEINQTVATLRHLLAKRCDLRSKQNHIHGTLVHRLPTELKSYIFEFLAPSRNEWGKPLPSRNEPLGMWPRIEKPIILYTSVCRNWRDIAWSNPLLWSAIHVTLPSSDPSSSTNFVQDWILRSRNFPLTLHIIYERECSESKSVIDALSQNSNRWHSLSFDTSPELLRALNHSNIQCHLLRNLRINSNGGFHRDVELLSNPTMSPEKIEIRGVPFRSLKISWNRLTSAKIEGFDAEDLTQLFQHALQMTWCKIIDSYDDEILPSTPIIHHRLKTLSVFYARATERFLVSLTLPCLQEFHANQMFTLKYLDPLARRSSCPLTKITFNLTGSSMGDDYGLFDRLQPLPGVTDLVIENVEEEPQTVTIQKLLLEEYFPDLRRLTLRLEAFHFLWDEGVVPLLLDRKLQRVGTGIKGRQQKILVIDPRCRTGTFFDIMKWNPGVGERLKALQVDVCSREDGFEILIPEG